MKGKELISEIVMFITFMTILFLLWFKLLNHCAPAPRAAVGTAQHEFKYAKPKDFSEDKTLSYEKKLYYEHLYNSSVE